MTYGISLKYSDKELSWIKLNRKLARKEAHKKFCNKFNRSDVAFENYKSLCTRKGWKTGRTGLIKKGSVPYNKGKKMAYNANVARAQFKKGRKPHNTKYIGHERIDSKDGYVLLNIGDRGYVLKHRYMWEKENGKLPEGMCLKCLNGDIENTNPSNWDAIPRGALPFLNGHRGHNYQGMPESLKPVVLTLAKVKYASSKAKKQF
jgi:hypothetical protein